MEEEGLGLCMCEAWWSGLYIDAELCGRFAKWLEEEEEREEQEEDEEEESAAELPRAAAIIFADNWAE